MIEYFDMIDVMSDMDAIVFDIMSNIWDVVSLLRAILLYAKSEGIDINNKEIQKIWQDYRAKQRSEMLPLILKHWGIVMGEGINISDLEKLN